MDGGLGESRRSPKQLEMVDLEKQIKLTGVAGHEG